MTDQQDDKILGEIVDDDNNQNRGPIWDKLVAAL